MSESKTLLQKITDGMIAIEQPSFDCEVDYTSKGRRTHYKYASLKTCMEAASKALNPLGVVVWHDTETIEDKTYIVTCFSDGTDTIKRCPFPADLSHSPQANASEFTYAKRYSLCGSLGIVADDDDDGQQAEGASQVNRGAIPTGRPKQSQQPNQKDTTDPLWSAKGRLKIAIQRYAEVHSRNEKDLMEGVKKRPDYDANKNNPEWFHQVAEEFDSES